MEYFLVVVIILLVGVIAFLVYFVTKKEKQPELISPYFTQLQQQMLHNSEVLERGLRSNQESMSLRLDKTSEMLGAVSEKLGEVRELGRGIKDVSDFLRSPKLRGIIGEQILKDVLREQLPSDFYAFQYTIGNGAIVDAIIKTEAGLLCIDAKFPFENYRKMKGAATQSEEELAKRDFSKDVRKHIDAIGSKYVVPELKTFDYALMYVPSESIYYEIICAFPELADFAQKKSVIMVSPSVFYAFLRMVMVSIEGKQVEEKAIEILRNFKGFEQDYKNFSSSFELGFKHLRNSQVAFDDASIKERALSNRITKILQLKEEN